MKTLAIKYRLAPLGLALALAAPVRADELSELKREVEALRAQVEELQQAPRAPRIHMYRARNPDRAMLGVVPGARSGKGVRIDAVSPGGPAEKSGLKAGDVVLAIDGVNLDQDRDIGSLMADKKPGQTLRLRVDRDGRKLDLNVKPVAAHKLQSDQMQFNFAWMPSDEDHEQLLTDMDRLSAAHFARDRLALDRQLSMTFDEGGSNFRFSFAGSDGRRLDLTSLSADLGRYFGVSEGVLVLASSGAPEGLKAGDVITAVARDQVSSPRQFWRIARDHQGDQLPVRVLRDRQPLELVLSKDLLIPNTPPAPPPAGAPVAPPAPDNSI